MTGEEPCRGGGHVERLMGPVVVVVMDPCVELGLRGGKVEEGAIGTELGAQCTVETLDLPRRGR